MSDQSDGGIATLAAQGSITLLGNILGKFLGFLFVVIATRLVSPSEYGVFTLGLSVVLFAQGFASLNVYRSIDYFVPQFLDRSEYGRAKKTLLNVFSIGTATSSLGAVAVFAFRDEIAALLNEPSLAEILPYFVLLIPLQTVYQSLLTSFNSVKNMKFRITIRDLLNPLTRILCVVLLVSVGGGVLGLVGGYLFGVFTAVVCGFGLLFYRVDWLRETASETVSNRALLSYSLPLVLAGVIYSLVGQIDYFVIGYFLDSAEVGRYQVAYLLASNLLIVLTAITPVFKPMIAEVRDDNALLEGRYRLSTRWVTMLTIPPAITLVVAPEVYLSLLFTEEYATAGAAVAALAVGYLLNASFGPEGMVLEGLGHTRLTLLNTFMLVSVNAILDIFLVSRLGIVGAGIATGTALAVAGLLGVVEIYGIRSIRPYDWRLLRVWAAAILPVVSGLFVIKLQIGEVQTAVLLPSVVVCSYVVGLRTVNGFSEEDMEIVLQIESYLGYPIISSIILTQNN
ncbi:oligosaccharide flippase family protein [Haloprofundus halophilus]|uniref:oligosaccharide flippase family protein n=1 Tax=Haloprofundus halophilus TaxID=2283527 RepID=UPI000E44E521|nr:oligosaccharide flippase family protein [Haloprofundus halophilus]